MDLDSIYSTKQITLLSGNVDSLTHRLDIISHTVMDQIIPQKELYDHIMNYQMMWFGFAFALLGCVYYFSVFDSIKKLKKDFNSYKIDLQNKIIEDNRCFQASIEQWVHDQVKNLNGKVEELVYDEYNLQANVRQTFYLKAIEKDNYALAVLLLLQSIAYTLKSQKKSENSVDDLILLLEREEMSCANDITKDIHEDICKEFHCLLNADISIEQKNRLIIIRESINLKYYTGISSKK